MARVVPSIVIAVIDRTFPWAKQADYNSNIRFAEASNLAGIVDLLDRLPNELLTRIFSGKKLTSEQLTKELGQLLGDRAPRPAPAEEEPFAIQFAEKQPISPPTSSPAGRAIVSPRDSAPIA